MKVCESCYHFGLFIKGTEPRCLNNRTLFTVNCSKWKDWVDEMEKGPITRSKDYKIKQLEDELRRIKASYGNLVASNICKG